MFTKEELTYLAKHFKIGDNQERRDLNDQRAEELKNDFDLMMNNHMPTMQAEIDGIKEMLK